MIIILVSGLILNITSQEYNKTPVSNEYKLSQNDIQTITDRINQSIEYYHNSNKKVTKKFAKLCKGKNDYIVYLNDHNKLMNHTALVQSIQHLIDYIVSKNNLDSNFYKGYILRSSEVNAANYGQGIITVNLGLLVKLNNVYELAFVLCHEIAHDLSNHVHEFTVTQAEYNKRKVKKKLKRSQNSSSKKTNLEKVYGIIAKKKLHSRKNEFIADSIGYLLYENLNFDTTHVYSVLTMLNNSKQFIYNDTLNLISILSSSNYSIQPKYLTQEDQYGSWREMSGLHDIPDLLKSHPNIADRKTSLKSNSIASNKNEKYKLINYVDFEELNKSTIYEYVHCLIEENNISKALYLACCRKKRGDNNDFIHAIICFSFYEFYLGIKNQNFSSLSSFPDEIYLYGYNKFLEFINSQNSKRFLKMANGQFIDYLNNKKEFELNLLVDQYYQYLNKRSSSDEITFQNLYYKQKFYALKKYTDYETP